MSLLAHSTYAAPGFEVEKRNLHNVIQHETAEANRIQRDTGCSRTEALRLAKALTDHSPLAARLHAMGNLVVGVVR